MLWLVFSSTANNFLLQAFINDVKGSLNNTRVEVLNGQNPIFLKMLVLVSEADRDVYIDELAGKDDGFAIPGAVGRGADADDVAIHHLYL